MSSQPGSALVLALAVCSHNEIVWSWQRAQTIPWGKLQWYGRNMVITQAEWSFIWNVHITRKDNASTDGSGVCYIFCVCKFRLQAPHRVRSMHERDAREGWEDLLPSIRSTNLLQVFLAVLPGHACSPLQEAPALCVHVWLGRRKIFSFNGFWEIWPFLLSSQKMR